MKTKLTMMVAAAMACAAVQLPAMPTEKETRRAEPVVKKLLAQERVALNSGKMTRSEVAAAAMGLADKAESEAEKLLLMKGACDFYVHAGEFDKAIETLQAMMMKIPDIPYATIVSILEYSLRGVSRNSAKDLWAFLDETKSRLRNTDTTHGKKAQSETNIQKFSRLFPGWEVCKEAQGRLGFELAYRGQFNVAVLHPVSQDIPAAVSRTLKLSGKNPCLFLKVSSCDYDGECDWVLSVRVNGKEVLPKRLINKTPNSELWEDITVPLFAWRGQEVKVEVVVTANGWYYEFASFKRLEIAEGSGRENLIPEAQETVDGYIWSYRVQNGEATIISEKEGKMSCAVSPNPVGSIVIPDILGGAKVTSIGRDALAGCQELESVTIPQGVKRIERQAFLGCKKLKSVEIPSSVIGIDWCAFYICNALATVDIPSDSNLKSLENGAFAGCFALKSIAIPDGVTRIARHAFLGCFNLKSLTIPATASAIGGEAFRSCDNLSSVTMLGEKPDTSVPPGDRSHTSDNIFLDCRKLKAIHVPANAKSWAGMKEWHGIPLVFDGEDIGRQAQTEGVRGRLLSRRGRLRNIRAESAAEQLQATVDGYTWSYRVNNGEARLVAAKDGKHSCAVSPAPTGSIAIPTSLNGVKVTSIGREAFKNCAGLTSVRIPEGATRIEWEAFRNCKDLTSVMIPESVTHIDYAFLECAELESVKLPSSLKSIGYGTFARCTKLTSLEIPEGVTSIGADAFNGCSGLESVVIPGSVTSIGDRAFIGCQRLTSVTIPAGVASIGEGAFGLCSGLKRIRLAAGNQSFILVDGVLYKKDLSVLLACPGNMTSVTIPSGVTKIGAFAFEGCNALTAMTIPEGVTNIEWHAFFGCGGLKSVTIPAGVKTIGGEAFRYCKGLTSVIIPEGVTHIDWNAFCDCSGLQSLTLPSSLKIVGAGAFGRCAGLSSVEIPDGVTCIEYDAFNGCSGLESVVIPDSVTSIGDRAFIGCQRLTSVTIPAGVANIGKGVFGGCNALKLINIDSGNQAYTFVDGVLYTKDRSELVMYPNPPASVVIPKDVKSIRGWAFARCRGMTSVTIPESVTSIGDVVFLDCVGLKSITIPSSVKNIGEHAFERCVELTEVTMLGERPDAPNNIFWGCGKLKEIHVPANAKSWAGMKEWFGIPLVFDAE